MSAAIRYRKPPETPVPIQLVTLCRVEPLSRDRAGERANTRRRTGTPARTRRSNGRARTRNRRSKAVCPPTSACASCCRSRRCDQRRRRGADRACRPSRRSRSRTHRRRRDGNGGARRARTAARTRQTCRPTTTAAISATARHCPRSSEARIRRRREQPRPPKALPSISPLSFKGPTFVGIGPVTDASAKRRAGR